MKHEIALNSLKPLGVGLGYRRPYHTDLFRNQCAVDFLEITADHFFEPSTNTQSRLDLLRDHFTLIPHGLGLSIGSAEGVDRSWLSHMAKLVAHLNPPYWSEHIAHTRAAGVEIGHLAPLPFSREAIDVVCRNIELVRAAIDCPLVLENITYEVALPGSEMSEGQFLTEILERTDCGLLLDITNLYANAVNHDYDARAFLRSVPLSRVVQLHFVGGRWESGRFVDDHSLPTPPEVWQLMDQVLETAPVRGVILERDENFPPFCDLADEIEQARQIGRRYGRWD